MSGAEAYKILLANGICPTCGTRKLEQNEKRCEICAAYAKKFYKRLKDGLKCYRCHKSFPKGKHTYCDVCREIIKTQYQERRMMKKLQKELEGSL